MAITRKTSVTDLWTIFSQDLICDLRHPSQLSSAMRKLHWILHILKNRSKLHVPFLHKQHICSKLECTAPLLDVPNKTILPKDKSLNNLLTRKNETSCFVAYANMFEVHNRYTKIFIWEWAYGLRYPSQLSANIFQRSTR